MGLDTNFIRNIMDLSGYIINLTTYTIMDKKTGELIQQLGQKNGHYCCSFIEVITHGRAIIKRASSFIK